MQLSDYHYDLPEAAIAIHPPARRGDTRLLRLYRRTGQLLDGHYKQLDQYLQAGDLLVINNTKVLPARLLATTRDGADRELLLLEKHGGQEDHHSSLAMYRRRIRPGQELLVGQASIYVEEVYPNGTAKVRSDHDLWELAFQQGHVPLPPYMRRPDTAADRERYQTEFASSTGSVAAPTASLNLTNKLLKRLQARGVQIAELTLHVGLGTFMPIRADDVTKHTMHREYFEIPADTAMAIRRARYEGRRVIAVGTTVTRTLEFASQQLLATPETGTKSLTPSQKSATQEPITGEADIFIYPGYDFKIVDGLLTNFHAPQSTVLMMAAAFAGWENLLGAYQYALKNDYKFLSYGDSMLITSLPLL